MSTEDRTLDLLRRLVEANPADFAARAHLAELLLAVGRGRDALALLEAAPTQPGPIEQELLLGQALASVDPPRAIAHYRAIVARDRRCAEAHFRLALLYRAQGTKDLARQHYGIAVVLDQTLEDKAFDDWIHEEGSTPAPPSGRVARATPAGDVGASAFDDTLADTEVPDAAELEAAMRAPAAPEPNLPKATFADVGGMDDLKEQLRMRVVYPFKNPEVFRKFQRRAGGGILLYGPPGCGKTHFARATAGECGARFVSVGIADILRKWFGESEQRLVEIFETARRRAPTVLFFDELDALGMDRREATSTSLQTVINQFLTELDGVGTSNENVLVLGATNAPWSVDSAFRRPGRFDRVLFVPPPDAAAREAILGIYLAKVPHGSISLSKCAKWTQDFSGADLRAVVENASDEAIREEMRTGKSIVLTEAMLRRAIDKAKPTTLEWLETARRYASYANRSGQYDDVAKYFEGNS